MKKIIPFVFLCFAFLFVTDVNAQYANIPDANFRTWLNNNGYASCMNGNQMDTTCPAVVNATKVNCQSSGISDLTGIQYFDNLDTLICSANAGITSFPVIHASLLHLKASSLNYLTYFPSFPPSLQYIDLQNAALSSLPALPPALTSLNCIGNNLTSLPALPSAMTTLWCSSNPLYTLPVLPSGLTNLDCVDDSLSTLPVLPNSLTYLNCGFNLLTSLPASLPPALYSLYCYNNQLTNLPTLPSTITYLTISNNSISSLPNVPPGLYDFRCDYNLFTSLPVFPNTLSYLYCQGNFLTSLPPYSTFLHELFCDNNLIPSLSPGFPSFLSKLGCSRNQLTALPALNPGLTYLNCSYNPITSLPSMPPGLTFLSCDSIPVTSLPPLPSTLDDLSCRDCPISVLPALPDTLNLLIIENTPLTCLPHIMKIGYFLWTGVNLSCLPNVIQITSPVPSVSSLGLCQPSGNCPVYWNITGNVFKDINANCIKDVNEDDLKMVPVRLDSAGIFVQEFLTDNTGDFSFRAGYGNYTVKIDTPALPFNVICPPSFSYSTTLSASSPYDSLANFGLQCKTGFDLQAKSIVSNGIIRPGVQRTMFLNAGDAANNFGTFCATGINGAVQAVLSGPVSYLSPAPGAITPSYISGDTIAWNVSDFSLSNPNSDFNINVLVNSTAAIGDTVCAQLSLTPVAGDNNPVNNILSACHPIVNSADPNAKYMQPSGAVDTSRQWFTFTVLFQNTGNAPAEEIYILDSLSNNLDASTFMFLSSSHEVIVQMLPGYVLRFNYPDINLPDSVNNEPASHGYVQFKLKRKTGLPAGTVISNKAYIYFDFNPAVITNTVSATLTLPVSLNETEINSFNIFPNPSQGTVMIANANFTFEKAEFFNVFGEKVFQSLLPVSQPGAATRLDISSLRTGIYFLKLTGKQGMAVRKMVKE